MQNCVAILQSQKKSKEGFFLGRLRERDSFLLNSIEPWRAGWQHGDLFVWIAASSAAMTVWGGRERFFCGNPTRDWRGARSALRSNGAGGRNPGKPVKNGLLADFSQGMNGGADKGSVQIQRKMDWELGWTGSFRIEGFKLWVE